jgi:hypothetical protein
MFENIGCTGLGLALSDEKRDRTGNRVKEGSLTFLRQCLGMICCLDVTSCRLVEVTDLSQIIMTAMKHRLTVDEEDRIL